MNLWILTEERPKVEVLQMIFNQFAKDKKCGFFGDTIRIIPILNPDMTFSFTYEVIGFKCAKVFRIYIKTVSSIYSFPDFLIFYQEKQPVVTDTPSYAIELATADDQCERNWGVYQRCSKFVFIKNFYPETKLIKLYTLKLDTKENPINTYIFVTRILLTLGVEIRGKVLDPILFKPFISVDDFIADINSMRGPGGNIRSILVKKINANKIEISGYLRIGKGHLNDRTIAILSILSSILRILGWKGTIEITMHRLQQEHVDSTNVFFQIANIYALRLQGLTVPKAIISENYWHYETKSEKLVTFFIHICIENFTTGFSIFENHASCEKGYFVTPVGDHIYVERYPDLAAYKAGNKDSIVYIPDLILLDVDETEAITVEGKKYINRQKGIEELNSYDSFDTIYLKKYYPKFKIVRTVVLYGSKNECIGEIEVGFLLNECGKLVLGIRAPKLFTKAINNLLSYWNK